MDGSRFDHVTRLFAERRITRRQALAQGSAGLAVAGAAVTELIGVTAAQQATPAAQAATPVPTGASEQKKTEFLFLQSFQSGSIVPKAGEAGTWTLTLEQGLGQTVYFSDRPERIVGVSSTDKFLQGLGFPKDNPPNAALLFENDQGDEDISVVELFNPQYDPTTHTATYEIQLLKEYAGLDMTFQQQPTEPPDAQATFGAAHLFIDDCADNVIVCTSPTCTDSGLYFGDQPICGTIGPVGYCYEWGVMGCYPCDPPRPHEHCTDEECSEIYSYWMVTCAETFAACNDPQTGEQICDPNYP